MAGKSDYLEGKVLDHIYVSGQTFAKPTKIYIGLFPGDPGEATGGTELTGNGYARPEITTVMTRTGDTVKNNADILFPVATGAWAAGADITHFATFDALTGGNRLHIGELTSPVKIAADQQLKIPVNQLVITED